MSRLDDGINFDFGVEDVPTRALTNSELLARRYNSGTRAERRATMEATFESDIAEVMSLRPRKATLADHAIGATKGYLLGRILIFGGSLAVVISCFMTYWLKSMNWLPDFVNNPLFFFGGMGLGIFAFFHACVGAKWATVLWLVSFALLILYGYHIADSRMG